MLSKVAIETALNAELDDHLGYEKNARAPSENKRNGKTSKHLKTGDGQLDIDVPRDIVDTFKRLYDADVSESLVSKVADAVMECVRVAIPPS